MCCFHTHTHIYIYLDTVYIHTYILRYFRAVRLQDMCHISPPKQMESFALLHFLKVPLSSLILPDLCRLGWGCRRPATGTGWSQAGLGPPPGPSCTPWQAQCASSLWAAAPRSTESSRRGARTWNLRGVRPTRSAPWSERRVWKCHDLKAFRLSRLRHGNSKSPFSLQKKKPTFAPLTKLSGFTAILYTFIIQLCFYAN